MPEQDAWLSELFEEDEELTDKQKKVMIAAIEIFAEKGYSATSTSEIAKKAGVAEGTIFRHYKTKKDLLISIVSPVMVKFVAPFIIKDLNKVLDREYKHFEDFLTAMLENRREFLVRNLSIVKILIQEIPFHEELKLLFKEHIGLKVIERFVRLVQYYQQKGEIIDLPPLTVVRITFTNVFGLLIARYLVLPEADWHDETETKFTIQFITKGLKP
ncbi:TetR/AcrR family transcriptional regulator [Bacillus sp. T33-2]|uniref:TetR/AcrR family transcriptional regulator n=1 Tax=Bacillus sp. T33-2 TaxID=2054168 RepID=UPI000C7834BF|nr:TetR/AcrR family transcriptional regulator [Bacillus sp. T33-2]PLR96553.1 TetR family transcriptional regulator [Bacillus sp. T33-2]